MGIRSGYNLGTLPWRGVLCISYQKESLARPQGLGKCLLAGLGQPQQTRACKYIILIEYPLQPAFIKSLPISYTYIHVMSNQVSFEVAFQLLPSANHKGLSDYCDVQSSTVWHLSYNIKHLIVNWI